MIPSSVKYLDVLLEERRSASGTPRVKTKGSTCCNPSAGDTHRSVSGLAAQPAWPDGSMLIFLTYHSVPLPSCIALWPHKSGVMGLRAFPRSNNLISVFSASELILLELALSGMS